MFYTAEIKTILHASQESGIHGVLRLKLSVETEAGAVGRAQHLQLISNS